LNRIATSPQGADASAERFSSVDARTGPAIAVYRDRHQVVFGLNTSIEHGSVEPGSGTMSRQPEPEPEPEPDADALKLSNDGIALFQVADELDNARRFNLPTVPTVR
jgi:hypothetical protein